MQATIWACAGPQVGGHWTPHFMQLELPYAAHVNCRPLLLSWYCWQRPWHGARRCFDQSSHDCSALHAHAVVSGLISVYGMTNGRALPLRQRA